MVFWLLFFGFLAGVTTALLGFGGGFVVVPVLYGLLLTAHGVDSPQGQAAMHIAVATSSAVMVYGSALATWRHQQRGHLPWDHIRPLLGPIGLGAMAGAAAATALSGAWLRWAFVIYLAISIVDMLWRPGFMRRQSAALRPMPPATAALAGGLIGAIAAFLGVGGSVMTVPLMRRRGASMTVATAMASPLALPMALLSSASYMLLAWGQPALGPWQLGYVDGRAALLLMLGCWLGIQAASPCIGRIADRWHARVYVALLLLVLLLMLRF
jgi:uncharacterized membrane protein YfcA